MDVSVLGFRLEYDFFLPFKELFISRSIEDGEVNERFSNAIYSTSGVDIMELGDPSKDDNPVPWNAISNERELVLFR